MDAIISSALEEICQQGEKGLALSSLCSKLALSVDHKRALWTNLLKIPTVQFHVSNHVYKCNDPLIRCFEDAEKLNLVIVATEKLCDNFLGIYDFFRAVDKEQYSLYRLTLNRIASARTNGKTQSQLSKEFERGAKETFNTVKTLEKGGLIVRQKATDKTRGAGKQGQSTKLIHLHRYAKLLGPQQKFEIIKVEEAAAGNQVSNIEHTKERVVVKDYGPSMKAICDKLEEADSKVLVISDIKNDLGYSGSRSKRRDWEDVCGRLKTASVVEEISVKVNGKDERCLRLLKKFSLEDFKHVEGQKLKMGRCQIANQLVELPIEHQMHDAIDVAGVKGMLITEVSQRFGVNKKANHKLCCTMKKKFGMPPMHKEIHKKTGEFRILTAKNYKSQNVISRSSKNLFSKNSILDDVNPGFSDMSGQIFGSLNSESDTLGRTNNRETEIELSCCSTRGSEAGDGISNTCKSQELMHETKNLVSDQGLHSMNTATISRKPAQYLTVDNTRREQRILEWLQVEKIVLGAELYRWLVKLEKEKSTTICRKSVDRILYKLENEGQCKYICLPVHKIKNIDAARKVKVALHPSIQSLSSEVLGRIRYRFMSYEKQTRGQASFRKKNTNSVLLLDGVQRTHIQAGSEALALRIAVMGANGFILGKMVRAKLLHIFLWDYACSSSATDDILSRQGHDLQNPYVTHNLFEVKAAIKGMPLELFLQVVGSTVEVANRLEKVKEGVRLCDLPIREFNDLNDAAASKRLSSILSILQRLELIHLVTSGSSDVYALELKPYIEEPPLIPTYSSSGCHDLCPDRDAVDEIERYDFILSNRDAVDEYWQVLEYIYTMSDQKGALNVFPGSTVHELVHHKSWSSGRQMTYSQHAKLLKLLVKSNFNGKLTYREYKEIATNLNLTLEQVLRECYAKFQDRSKVKDNLNAVGAECQPLNNCSFSQKRKRSAEARALKHRKVDNETEPWSRQVAKLESPRKPGHACDSQFPSNTGSSAAKFSRWLRAREKDFQKGGVDLTADLQCGETFHLFALVSSGELFISPRLPVEGVGEADTSLYNDSCDGRREKGFPGIKLSMHREPKSRAVALELSFEKGERCGNENFFDGNYLGGISESLKIGSNSSQSEVVKKNANLRSAVPANGDACESPWELMVGYATNTMPLPSNQDHAGTLSPEVFKAVYAAIQKAGDQGLVIREVSGVMDTLGEKMAELVIDVLQKFGQAEKVKINGSLHVIAASMKKPSSIRMDDYDTDLQKFTIHNHEKDVSSLIDKTRTCNLQEDSMQRNVVLPGANNRHDLPRGSKSYDADRITKKNIHNRIISQTFRVVMQNPGILEDDIIRKMKLPNHQHCKKLLRLMVRDKHVIVKKMLQSIPSGVPDILGALIGGQMKKSKLIYREHFFANPMSTSLL